MIQIEDIKEGITYRGELDWNRGFGTHRVVTAVFNDLILFRVVPGPNPPKCYISGGTMSPSEFAEWAIEKVE